MPGRMHASSRTPTALLQLTAVLAAVVLAIAPLPPALIERWFSLRIFPHVQRVLTPASNLLPIAWLDILTIAAAAWLAWRWRRALRSGLEPRWPRVGRALVATTVAAAVTYLAFLALWGFNYRRVPMLARVEVARPAPATSAVAELGRQVVGRLNALHAPAHGGGWRDAAWRNDALTHAFAAVQQELTDAPPAVPGRLKRSIYGPFFRWTSVDGMVNPFGLEVLANPDLLPFERPFVAAHEWGHLAGFADEPEANFVGWLACVRADVASQYSGWLYLYWQIAGELPREEREALGRALSEGPREDLAAIAARLRRGDLPALRRASWMVYDSYLKANRVEAGVRSYGAVVTLILRARFEDGWRPVRRASVP
jgi:hypothetical protein